MDADRGGDQAGQDLHILPRASIAHIQFNHFITTGGDQADQDLDILHRASSSIPL